MKPRLLIVLALLVPMWARALPPDSLWMRTYGSPSWDWEHSEWCYAIGKVDSNHYYLAGDFAFQDGGEINMGLCKVDQNGTTQWCRNYGGIYWESCYGADRDDDGNYYLAGTTESFGNGSPGSQDAWLLKVNSNGDSLWSRPFGYARLHDVWNDVVATPDGGAVCAGWTSSFTGPGEIVPLLMKYSAQGDSLWCLPLASYRGVFRHLARTPDGGFVAVGELYNAPLGDSDIWIVKFDSEGNVEWEHTFGTELRDVGDDVDVGADGSIFVGGYVHEVPAQIPSDFWVAKLTADGDTLWTRRIGDDPHYELGHAVRAAADGGCFLGGERAEGPSRMWLARLNSAGDTLWTRDWGCSTEMICFALEPLRGDSVLLAGIYYTFPGVPNYDWALLCVGPRTSSAPPPGETVKEFRLFAPYPNPFNASTRLAFELPRMTPVRLEVIDVLGRRVALLADRNYPAGSHTITFDGSALSTGIYFFRLQAGKEVRVGKMVLLK